MPMKYLTWITREMVRDNPEARFVFGDNVDRKGYGGQAKAMRGEPNAIGIVTKWSPSMHDSAFFSDIMISHGPRDFIDVDIDRVERALREGRVVYAPRDGLGTGLSELPQRAPRLYNLIVARFSAFPGEACPWPMVQIDLERAEAAE